MENEISAEQTRNIQLNNPRRTEQLDKIFILIKKYISEEKSDDQHVYWYKDHLTKFTINRLEELGYKVEDISTQKDGAIYRISWEKDHEY